MTRNHIPGGIKKRSGHPGTRGIQVAGRPQQPSTKARSLNHLANQLEARPALRSAGLNRFASSPSSWFRARLSTRRLTPTGCANTHSQHLRRPSPWPSSASVARHPQHGSRRWQPTRATRARLCPCRTTLRLASSPFPQGSARRPRGRGTSAAATWHAATPAVHRSGRAFSYQLSQPIGRLTARCSSRALWSRAMQSTIPPPARPAPIRPCGPAAPAAERER